MTPQLRMIPHYLPAPPNRIFPLTDISINREKVPDAFLCPIFLCPLTPFHIPEATTTSFQALQTSICESHRGGSAKEAAILS